MRAIVTFHSIDDSGSVLSFAPGTFGALLEALGAAGIPVRDLDDLLGPDAGPGVALTFDDGLRSVFSHALPVLRGLGAPAHLFLATGRVGADNRWPGQPGAAPRFDMLDWGEIEALHAAGVRIESHTAGHPDLRALDAAGIAEECEAADAEIERLLGRRPRYFAYPYGFHDARVRDAVRGRYRGCVTTELRYLAPGEDPAALPRLDSYYLRPAWTYRDLGSARTRTYLALRHWLRRARGAS